MIWLSPEQLNEIGVTKAILRHNRDIWKFRSTLERGRNGKAIREVLLESMQQRWQDAYLAWLHQTRSEVSSGSLTTEPLTQDPEGIRPLSGVDTDDHAGADLGGRRLMEAASRYEPGVRDAFLAEAQRLSVVVEKYRELNPKRRDGKFVAEVFDLARATACTNPAVLAIEPARAKARSPYTMDTWLKEYDELGLAAFLRKPPEPKAIVDRRRAVISPEAVEYLNANWRKTPSPDKLYQKLQKEARRNRWTIPARGWVYRKYQELPTIAKVVAFEGNRAYTGRHAPYLPRTAEGLTALQMLVGDHSVRDVMVMLPSGELKRPWLTLWQCVRTGLIWGWHLDLEPSSETIALAYADGVRNFGAQPFSNPDTGFFSYVYTDQGKDYKSHRLAGKDLELDARTSRISDGLKALCTQYKVGVYHELGLKHRMAAPYNAREKMVERTHRDISAWEQNTFTAEYVGRSTTTRPDAHNEAFKRHQKLRKTCGKNVAWLQAESAFMGWEDYRDALSGWILEYNSTSHKRTTLMGSEVTPIQEYQRLYTTKYEIPDEILALMLMKVERRKIGKNGVGITMFQTHWEFAHEALGRYAGQWVEVRYTDQDYNRIWVVLPDGSGTVEAMRLTRSPIENPNKQTVAMVKKLQKSNRETIRGARLVEQNAWNGITAEDEVATIVNEEPDEPQAKKMAVNARPIVQRFDRSLAAVKRPGVSLADVEAAPVIDMFSREESSGPRIREEWE